MTVSLNEAQRDAVEAPGGPLLVLAGAGSGKTRVLTARIAHLIQREGTPPERILAVTFTNKAAQEMRDRIARLLGFEPRGMWVGTFHSLAARLLRREARHLGFGSNFSIYDEDDRKALVKRLLIARGHATKDFPAAAIAHIISHAKNRMQSPDNLIADAHDPFTVVAADVYSVMGRALRAANAMDFDDLLLHPLRLFTEHPDRLELYRQRFVQVLVDEFQDTNRPQYLFVKALSEQHQNVTVVGDDDQAIYGWRGADVRHMLGFHEDFPAVRMVRLEENYRSTAPILTAANHLIAANADRLGKTLRTAREDGTAVAVCTAADERDEADWVVKELRALSQSANTDLMDMAVLYRTNAQSRALEDACRRHAVPYRVIGAVSFYERREVKDLIAYLRLVANADDDEAFLRAVQVPKRGIGGVTLAALVDQANQLGVPVGTAARRVSELTGIRSAAAKSLQGFCELVDSLRGDEVDPAGLLERLVEALQYERYLAELERDGVDRWDNVRELIASAADWSEVSADGSEDDGTPLERFLAQASLTTPADRGGEDRGLTLMTVHTAKGLEWPVVVLAGLEDGLFPLARAEGTPGGVEEERRLCYVGMTRAQDRLYLTWARSRRRGGEMKPARSSRFLAELGDAIEERQTGGWWVRPASAPRRSWAPQEPADLFEVSVDGADVSQVAPRYQMGERVRHRRFGVGTIVGLARARGDVKVAVTFDDDQVGTKQLMARYAGLEREFESA